MIKIENLSKYYGTKQVLNSVTINIGKGEVVGVVGENGAGKTTLFRCIAGLEKYDGNITTSVVKIKPQLGYLETEPYFFSKITGKEYIQLLVNARNRKIIDFEKQNIFELPLNQYASTYSTGMKKKLAITAILMQENNCFIFDEPFNGVDIQSNIIITEIIHKLKQLGKTILISSHIFSTLSETCDEIHLLKNGEVIRSVTSEKFSNLEKEMKEITLGNRVEKMGLS